MRGSGHPTLARFSALWTAGVVLVVGLALGAPSEAQTPGPDPSPREEEARRHYEEGIRHYRLAEYAASIAAFRAAYRLTEAPELLYNIAQAYRLEGPGHCARAERFYSNYLLSEPGSERRAAVEAALVDMERCARSEQAAPDESEPAAEPPPAGNGPASAAPPSTRADAGTPVLALGTLGLGIALGAAGAAFLLWAEADFRRIEDTGCAPRCDPALTAGPRGRQTAGAILAIGGAVTLAAGLGLWILLPGESDSRVSMWVAPTPGGISIGAGL